MPTETRPPWRPSLYKPEYCDLLVEHMEKGYSFESFGAIANCSKQTLYNWLENHPDFVDAKSLGLSKGRFAWETIAQDGIWNTSGGSGTHRNLNTTAWIFNMKNRFGWRDQPKDDGPGDDKKSKIFVIDKDDADF